MCAATNTDAVLLAILNEIKQIKLNQATFEQKLEQLASVPSPSLLASSPSIPNLPSLAALSSSPSAPSAVIGTSSSAPAQAPTVPFVKADETPLSPSLVAQKDAAAKGYSQRVILTTYPGQVGIQPIPLRWGAPDPQTRGPVVASRQPKTLKVRNTIGAHGGSYSIYRALAVACGQVDPFHRPDFTNTEPPVDIPHNPAWDDPSKIVSIDPYGHLAPQLYKSYLDAGLDIRPTIAITKAHIKLIDIDEAVRSGTLEVDGKIVVKTPTDWVAQNRQDSTEAKTGATDPTANSKSAYAYDAGVELNVSKAALEPVWFLPGIAARFGISEGTLRRALFEDTGGMYPELLTRHDLKVFLPPIGGMTVYIFGNPDYIRDESKELTLRIHDECNGSDVFGSDICTCRPYLIFGIEEAVKCAQRGGVGIVVYFRKEGRALGEVLKYLVYNARKRGGDEASMYFARTEQIAGVKDMRFQSLMPDVLHWLGVKRIDNLISMSDMKYDAIVGSGIKVVNRYEIDLARIPADGQVEILAKVHHGYHSKSKVEDISKVHGRLWEDVDH